MSPQHDLRMTRNNFDLLRLLLAGSVCLVHAYQLSGFEALRVLGTLLSSDVAVKAFFVVSGFLIFMSFERSRSLAAYASRRIRRIYPAYFTVVMVCAFGMLAVSSRNAAAYFSPAWVKYVAANLSFLNFLQPTLPGVFEANRMTAVNGALWTLKVEAMFYVGVPLFVFLFRRFGHLRVLVLLYVSSVAYAQLMDSLAERTGSGAYAELSRQLPGQLAYFMAAAFHFYFPTPLQRHTICSVAGAAAVLAVNHYVPLPLLEPFALATLVVFAALFFYAGNFGKYGDFSYGIYILHFPIIQLLAHSGWFGEDPWGFLGATVALTLASAMAMWHLVEKRFLLRHSHYMAAAEPERGEAGSGEAVGAKAARR